MKRAGFCGGGSRRRGALWLMTALVIGGVLSVELIAVAGRCLAELRTVATVEIQTQASYAADAGVAVARALIRAGRPPQAAVEIADGVSVVVRGRRWGSRWRVVSTGRARGPLGVVGERTVEAVVCGDGRTVRWRYLRPLEPAGGKT